MLLAIKSTPAETRRNKDCFIHKISSMRALSLLCILFFLQCISSQNISTYLSIGVYKNNNDIGKCIEDNFQFGLISLQNGYCVPSYLPFNEDNSPLHMYLDEYNHVFRCKSKYCGIYFSFFIIIFLLKYLYRIVQIICGSNHRS